MLKRIEGGVIMRVVVVGGGAAGLTAAGTAAANGHDVTLFERNSRPARKLLLTGKGRCNVTNNQHDLDNLIAAVPVNGRFLYGAFSRLMPSGTIDFFESLGVPLKVERGGRVFPVSDSSRDIADALVKFAASNGVKTVFERVKELVTEDGAVSGVKTFEGTSTAADKVIIATGGLSYPQTGSTGDGYDIARSAGHKIVSPKPSLVPLCAHEGFCSQLMGLSLKNISIKVIDTDKNSVIYNDFGELIFTHFGLSGPVILSASSHMREMRRKKYVISIDLKPALSIERLDARILRDFSENLNKNFINALNGLLPKKLVPVVVKLSGIGASQKTNQITKEQRGRLAALLKDFRVTITDFRPIDEAVITSGGIDVSEIDPKTMESKLMRGLFFAGEVIDVDAFTGGYNLQIAFSTGSLAGMSV